MPAKDIFHDACVAALIKDGWTITNAPLTIRVDEKAVQIDLAAERLITAERGTEKIAVEVKSFVGASDIRDVEEAVGQYVFYKSLLRRSDPDRRLFLAVPEGAYRNTLSLPICRPVIEDAGISLLAFAVHEKEIVRWEP